MAKARTRSRIVLFLALMGVLMILFAFFTAIDFSPVTDLGWLKLLVILETLSLGVTEICVAWLMHHHLQ